MNQEHWWLLPNGITSPPLIEFRNVSVMRGDRVALDRINLSIGAHENVVILGPNGCGKSTLIKTITRECYPLFGNGDWSLRIFGRDRWNLFDLRPLLGIVSNDWMLNCTRDITGLELILSGFFGSIGLGRTQHVTPRMEQEAFRVLELLEIRHLAGREITELSSGEARRILIGRALIHKPKALILDEPTTSLDIRATYELREILRKIAQAGTGIVLVTHNLPDIIPEITRAILIKEGKILQHGPKEDILNTTLLREVFGSRVELAEKAGYYHLW